MKFQFRKSLVLNVTNFKIFMKNLGPEKEFRIIGNPDNRGSDNRGSTVPSIEN